MKQNIKRFAATMLSVIMSVVCIITMLPTPNAYAEDLHGFYAWVVQTGGTTVYRYKNLTTKSGYLSIYEGVTVLVEENDSYYVEYSNSTSTSKRGYISKDSVYKEETSTCVGKMRSGQTVYYGKSKTRYQKVGSVSTDEYVAVLANDGTWAYVEYNTKAGRKRGYVPTSSVIIFNAPSGMQSTYKYNGSSRSLSSPWECNVWAGPSEEYFKVGSINAGESITIISEFNISFNKFYFIEYTENSTGLLKSGYVLGGVKV